MVSDVIRIVLLSSLKIVGRRRSSRYLLGLPIPRPHWVAICVCGQQFHLNLVTLFTLFLSLKQMNWDSEIVVHRHSINSIFKWAADQWVDWWIIFRLIAAALCMHYNANPIRGLNGRNSSPYVWVIAMFGNWNHIWLRGGSMCKLGNSLGQVRQDMLYEYDMRNDNCKGCQTSLMLSHWLRHRDCKEVHIKETLWFNSYY